jgi:Domain found in Dishevelled, Egl-10, and Pleckstrin (DEP)
MQLEEEEEDGGYGNVIDLSSSDEEYDDYEEDELPEAKVPLMRRAIFLAQERPIQTLTELVDEMRFGQSPLPLKSRKHRLRSYKKTFIGREAVDWIMLRMNFETR